MFLETYHPHTFAERGVAVPFTTPALVGARLRLAAGVPAPELEVVIPNPAGGRGVYIVFWADSGDLCRPGVYDVRLVEAFAAGGLARLTPAMVRHRAWETASRGYAGRLAAAAAKEALREQAVRFALASTRLESERAGLGGKNLAVDAVAWERLTALFADLSATADAPSRLRARLSTVDALARSVLSFAATAPAPIVAAAQAVSAAAAATVQLATPLLARAEARVAEPTALLRAWLAEPEAVEEELSRADWALDGWDRLLQLFRLALPRPEIVVQEMAALLPCWPDEVETWLALPKGCAARLAWRHPATRVCAWAETTAEAVARNELLAVPAV